MRKNSIQTMILTLFVTVATFSGNASAALIFQPTGVEDFSSQTSGRSPLHSINTNGLLPASSPPYTTDAFHTTGANNKVWTSASGTIADQYVVYDFGAEVSFQSMWMWPYFAGTQDLKTFDIYVGDSTTTVKTSQADWRTELTKLNASALADLAQHAGATNEVIAQEYNLGGVTGVQYLMIDVLTNYGSTTFVGLAEIGFTAIANPIPEPSALTLAALGVLGFGLARRRRRVR